jgi:hypothetical protein
MDSFEGIQLTAQRVSLLGLASGFPYLDPGVPSPSLKGQKFDGLTGRNGSRIQCAK